MNKKKIILLIFILIICVISIISCEYMLNVSKFNIKLSKLPDEFNGYKILQLSDFHSKEFRQGNEYLIKKINEESPNIIVMTGDMINSDSDNFSIFADLAKKLASKYDVYYIFGNHEMNLSQNKQKELIDIINECGVKIINNEKQEIIKENNKINIYGLNYELQYYFSRNNFTYELMNESLENTNSDEINILLAHNPIDFKTYRKWGADLTFAGHVHGGVVRIPFLKGILSPDVNFFPKYDKGLYIEDNKSMVVSTGLGYGTLPIRLFNLPEIVVVTLEK